MTAGVAGGGTSGFSFHENALQMEAAVAAAELEAVEEEPPEVESADEVRPLHRPGISAGHTVWIAAGEAESFCCAPSIATFSRCTSTCGEGMSVKWQSRPRLPPSPHHAAHRPSD